MHSFKSLRFYLLYSVLFFLTQVVFSQMYVPFGAVDYSQATSYGEDTIYLFYADNPDKLLQAEHSTQDTSDFVWSRFDKETKTFDTLFIHPGSLVSEVSLDSLYSSGSLGDAVEGLRVEVTSDEGVVESYTSWVVLDTFPDFGEIWVEENTCDRIWLAVQSFSLSNYTYYDLSDTPVIPLTLYNERSVRWSASEDVDIFAPNTLYQFGDVFIGKIGQVSEFGGIMPYEDSDYYLTVTNSFGNQKEDTITNIPAKASLAAFSIKKVLPDGTEEDYSKSGINEALLEIRLENNSENATNYHWIGYNDSLEYSVRGADTIVWENFQEVPSPDSIPLYRPGKYAVKLITENEYECIDSTTFYHVEVDSSMIDSSMIPNVFTPNGDNRNDRFVLPKRNNLTGDAGYGVLSMRWIEVTILNRSGELVYQYKGHPDDWEGWNGKVKNSNRDAAEGIYVYVIKGRGYDGVLHENKQYSGILYLYR